MCKCYKCDKILAPFDKCFIETEWKQTYYFCRNCVKTVDSYGVFFKYRRNFMNFYVHLTTVLLIISSLLVGIVSATATTNLIPVLIGFILAILSLGGICFAVWMLISKLPK